MPKIRDLGINVIPETMRPPEIGPGGGGDCQTTVECADATNAAGTPGTLTTCLPGTVGNYAQGTLTTCLPGTVGNYAQGTLTTCLPGTVGNYAQGTLTTCLPGTVMNCMAITLTTCLPGTVINCMAITLTTCLPGTVMECTPGTRITTPHITYAAATQTGQPAAAGLTRDAIDILKNQLHQQIAQLEEIAKGLGPNTVEEIDAREQQLKAELEELANCRNRLTSDEK